MQLEGIPKWARWILVIPSAVVAMGAVEVTGWVLHTIPFFNPGNGGLISFLAYSILRAVLGPFLFVKAGSLVAPKWNKGVAILLAIVISVVHLGAIYAAYSRPETNEFSPPWWLYVGALIGIVSGWAAALDHSGPMCTDKHH